MDIYHLYQIFLQKGLFKKYYENFISNRKFSYLFIFI